MSLNCCPENGVHYSQPLEVAYEYDGNGNRSMVVDGSDTTDELYNRADQRLWTDDETDHTATDYLYLNGHVIAKVAHPDNQAGSPSDAHYQHDDLLGSTIAATDSYGNILWQQPYTPYGKPLFLLPIRPNHDTGYTGKPYDTNIGLSYYGARYYDPEIGRFMTGPKEFRSRFSPAQGTFARIRNEKTLQTPAISVQLNKLSLT